MQTKTSPFVLTDSRLSTLANACEGDRAVLDLVRAYRQAQAHVAELREMLELELDYFRV